MRSLQPRHQRVQPHPAWRKECLACKTSDAHISRCSRTLPDAQHVVLSQRRAAVAALARDARQAGQAVRLGGQRDGARQVRPVLRQAPHELAADAALLCSGRTLLLLLPSRSP